MNDKAGHRERLRKRFLKAGLNGFHDYEVIELILSYAIPRKDTKSVAKELVKGFGGLRGVFDAEIKELTRVDGIGLRSAILVKLLKDAAKRYLGERLEGKAILGNPQEVINYSRIALSGERVERFDVIYLNSRNEVLGVETLHEGTIDQTVVYPRKVIEGALRHNSKALIFLHNHPSGDPQPSRQDRRLTEELVKAAKSVDITVHDHIILGRNSHFSARENGWV